MSQPPPLPPPLPIDYASPSQGPHPPRLRRPFSGWMYLAGIGAGFAMSFVAWWIYFHVGWSNLNTALIGIGGIIVTKLAAGWGVEHTAPRRGFLSGVVSSIALVPLIALGTVAVVCFSGNIRLN